MFNLLRGELYKLWRTKSLYICSVVLVVFVLLVYGMFSLADMMMQGEVANGSYGLTVNESAGSVWNDMGITYMLQMMFSSVSVIIIAIFTSIYIYADYTTGAIKNVVGKGYGRIEVFLSKVVSTMVGTVVMQLLMVFSVFLCEIVLLGASRMNADVFIDVVGYTAMQLLLGSALTALIVMIGQICRNLGAGIAISTCMIMFSSFVTAGINALLKLIDINVNVCDYWMLDLISNCPVENMDNRFVFRAVICAIVSAVLAIAVGGTHFRKVDVK